MKTSMSKFMTRSASNAGVRIPLTGPDGKDTGEYLTVRGMDSDAFRAAQAATRRKFVELKAKWDAEGHVPTREDSARYLDQERLDLLVSLVADWSLEEPCTPENVRTLLTEAPGLADLVDTVASQRYRFFNVGLDSCVPGSGPKQS